MQRATAGQNVEVIYDPQIELRTHQPSPAVCPGHPLLIDPALELPVEAEALASFSPAELLGHPLEDPARIELPSEAAKHPSAAIHH